MRRIARFTLATIIASTIAPSVAHAETTPQPLRASDGLSTPVTFTGSGDTATAVRTEELRGLVPAPANPRIHVIGTGVARGLFPTPITAQISGPVGSLVDQHGYGTLAASTILQLASGARVTSRAIRSADSTWHLIDLNSLADALTETYANRAAYDSVLLAFPPNGALDPMSHIIGHASYPGFGQGDALLAEALLAARGDVRMRGIPTDAVLRSKVFAGLNDRQRDAVERFVTQARGWTRVVNAIRSLTSAGVAVVAPTGDFTRVDRNGDIVPLPHQTIYGVAALPEVVTVGSAYTDNPTTQLGVWRVSPTSGRGPTLTLDQKPDLVAASDIVGMLPVSATLQWPDDSLRTPPALLRWAQPGVLPSTCPSPTRAYRCVLQASSMVSAALVATNLAATVNRGVPHLATARTPLDDEFLRGFAWSAADQNALTYPQMASISADGLVDSKPLPPADQDASPFEQGVGVFTGFASRSSSVLPIALAPGALGEIGYSGSPVTLRVPTTGASAAPTATTTHHLGPDASGRAILRDVTGAPVASAGKADGFDLIVSPANRDGGVWSGVVKLTSPNGGIGRAPVSFVQDVPFRFHADYAYNELMTGGLEGERVEDASVMLMAGLPANVGLVGEGFKLVGAPAQRSVGGDPLHNVIVRTGRARSVFREPSLPAAEHGRGTIDAVPPGFYRFHLISDHAVEAVQESGVNESLGIGLGSFGPDGFASPASMILVSGETVCDEQDEAGCLEGDPTTQEMDERTGFCVARNTESKVEFGVYCGEVAYAVPGAVVTRAVHLVKRDEWHACTVGLRTDGSITSLESLVADSEDCETVAPSTTNGKSLTNPTGATPADDGVGLPGTAWTIDAGSKSCLAPAEAAANPNGHPSDLTASFQPLPGLINDEVPTLVLSTSVPLPYLNTYTTGTLTFAYEAEGALVVTRFEAGAARATDAGHSILALNGLGIPGGADPRGTYLNEWALMSANAPTATVSIVAFPTSATSAARIALCDVALRVATFAKQTYGERIPGATVDVPVTPDLRSFPVLDRGLTAMITPASYRARANFSGTAFTDAGVQREDVVVATHIPRNTTRNPGALRHVLSPFGGPAAHAAARRWGTDGKRHEIVATRGVHDPERGRTSLACSPTDPACQAWNAARNANALLTELSPDLYSNGRFNGVAVADHASLTAAMGNLAFDTSMATDDGGAFGSRWSAARRFSVSTFSTTASESPTMNPLDPVVQVIRDAANHPVVTIRGTLPGGVPAAVTAVLT
jgi:hypothetical protein